MIKKYLTILLLGAAMASCTDSVMDDINKDTANPASDVVNAKFQVTNAIMGTCFHTLSGDYSFYASSYTEQEFGTGNNQLKNAELRDRNETAASTTFNNVWNATYGTLMNVKQMLDKCQEGGVNAGQTDVRGIAQVLWVINFQTLTDMHGDIPYSEALVADQPKLDSQESIYADLQKRIDEAISDLGAAVEKKENHCGSQDILFNGSAQKWLGLAYAVKARLLLNTAYRNPGVYKDVIAAGEKALEEGFDGASLAVFNGVDCDNPWAAYNWSRYYAGANGTLYDIMASREDPRLDLYAADIFETGVLYAPAGDATLAGMTETVGYPYWLDNGAATVDVVGLQELHFILAEAKVRLGQDASADFAKAVQASFDDWSLSCGEDLGSADDYLATLQPSFEEIMAQKYIAQARDQQVQTYNDIRRLKAEGNEVVKLRNPNNTSGGANQWPLRLPYGNSDVVSNPNVAEAFGYGNASGAYLFTENIWLFGGSK